MIEWKRLPVVVDLYLLLNRKSSIITFSFLSFFLSFFFLFYYMPITLSIFASCNLFRSNNFLASLAFIQAHSICLIMASFLYTEQILFVRLPIGLGTGPYVVLLVSASNYWFYFSTASLSWPRCIGWEFVATAKHYLREALLIKTIDRYNRNANTRETQYCGKAGKKREEDAL